MSHVVDAEGRYVRVGDVVTRLATGDAFFLVAVASPVSVWVDGDRELNGTPVERPAWCFGLEVVR